MKKQHKDCSEVGAQLAELHSKLQIQKTARKELKSRVVSRAKKLFHGRAMIAAIALLVLLGTDNLLYGQSTTDALFIDKDGNVGIGTSEPTARLDVAGAVKANEFTTNKGVSLCNIQTAVTNIQKDMNVLNLQVPIGTIMAYGGDTTNIDIGNQLREQGWLPCSGIVVSRDEYKDLYDVIGAAFGSNSDTTFQVPDMRGQFLRGVDQGSKRDPDAGLRQASAPNSNTGDKVGSMQEDQLKSHKHAVKAAHAGYAGGSSTGDPIAVAGWSRNPANKEVEAAGGAETRPKNISVNWIIKAKHMLPLKP